MREGRGERDDTGRDPHGALRGGVQPVTLAGVHVRLAPLERSHLDALCAAGLDPSLWQATTIRVRTRDEMSAYLERALAGRAAGTAMPFAILAAATGGFAGTTRYHDIEPRHRRLEIGFTWIAPAWQRTAVNTETKYLLLRHAFETLGCVRVSFKADAGNERSSRALLRIGAVREGTLRRYMWSEHRGSRDIAIFSIVEADWPAVKTRLEAMLSAS
jgi:N-acetyltransferase